MKPTQVLLDRTKTRLRFTTKNVGRGFYRGNRVGSLGAHTTRGGYQIDYRKVPHFVVPNMKDHTQLSPFVTTTVQPNRQENVDEQGVPFEETNWVKYLKWTRDMSPANYDYFMQQKL